ncbi:unnamed protein product [Adineta ricciae]|uniref:CYTH domain-containing protein n=1 Tax=Adineta ricciae TaxID=249248 RepID=A0A814QJ19_ADIRI|nr:unnamed protein product [Adineta ricciae]CAF1126561.1 unnamed protein product [Adineta ricciae]
MPRNVEIKARIDGTLDELISRIQPLADGPPRHLTQSDTFFACPTGGRLKLRIEQNSPAQLIYYERNDVASLAVPKLSDYSIAPISHPDELKKVLSLAMGGIRGQIDKDRTVLLTGQGQTRIHLDRVKGLESTIFIELEVVLRDDQTAEQGQLIAKDLCEKIGIEEKNHIKCAYVDLLLEQQSKQ